MSNEKREDGVRNDSARGKPFIARGKPNPVPPKPPAPPPQPPIKDNS
jgi:hypothetical protein